MKIKLALLFPLVITTLTLFICCSSSEFDFLRDVKVELSYEAFSEQPHYSGSVKIGVGGKLTVVLCSNATTGFSWSESAQISDQTVLKQMDHTFLPPTSNQTGAAGKEVWTFKAIRQGMSTVYLEYGQPWEGGAKKAWTFNLTVFVESGRRVFLIMRANRHVSDTGLFCLLEIQAGGSLIFQSFPDRMASSTGSRLA
jgi:inhibitor of cysteine peptidase